MPTEPRERPLNPDVEGLEPPIKKAGGAPKVQELIFAERERRIHEYRAHGNEAAAATLEEFGGKVSAAAGEAVNEIKDRTSLEGFKVFEKTIGSVKCEVHLSIDLTRGAPEVKLTCKW